MKIKIKVYERILDSTIHTCSLYGLIIPNLEWADGVPYLISYR